MLVGSLAKPRSRAMTMGALRNPCRRFPLGPVSLCGAGRRPRHSPAPGGPQNGIRWRTPARLDFQKNRLGLTRSSRVRWATRRRAVSAFRNRRVFPDVPQRTSGWPASESDGGIA